MSGGETGPTGPASLDDVMHVWAYSSWRRARLEADWKVDAINAVRLYKREGHGLLIWRAYRSLRAYGLPVWESILSKFDEWSMALETAATPEDVARAIEALGSGKSHKGIARLASRERAWLIASAVKHAQRERDLRVTQAIEWVAVHGGWMVDPQLGVPFVKRAYYETFPRASGSRAKSD